MLKHLKIKQLGPFKDVKLDFGDRLNIITGDNGLGKSFLLDIAWWVLTKKWPAEINSQLVFGLKARPVLEAESQFDFGFTGVGKKVITDKSTFISRTQTWKTPVGRPTNPGLVMYVMADGGFAVWDPARNYWNRESEDFERVPAYVFSPSEVWNGLKDGSGKPICEGLIRDWADWQKLGDQQFNNLKQVLQILAPSGETLMPGALLDDFDPFDSRYMPSLNLGYGEDVPLVHLSSAFKRVVSIAYLLLWSWQENGRFSKKFGESSAHQLTLLIDEPEVHLHPKWQRTILASLLKLGQVLGQDRNIQIITTTHSPLILASAESVFDSSVDAWFDIDFDKENKTITVEKHEALQSLDAV